MSKSNLSQNTHSLNRTKDYCPILYLNWSNAHGKYSGSRALFRMVMFSIAFFLLLGTNSLRGQMLDRSDTRVQTTLKTGMKVIGSLSPKNVREVGDQSFTIGCETLDRDFIYWDTYKEYLVPLGVKRIRLQGGWAKTEKVKGTLNFKWLDDIIDDARNRGLEIWLETCYGNPIYEGGGGPDLAGGFPSSPEALAAWDRWVEALARRYKDKVWAWAMWNEPDHGKKTIESIALFNIRTAEVIKKVIPEAKIGALSLAFNDPVYLDKCLAPIAREGKLGLFHWVIYHGYTMVPEEAYANVEKMKEVVAKYDPNLKLWQGENGAPSEYSPTFALLKYPWSELTQAKWDARRILGDLGHDVLSSIFTICDYVHKGRALNRKGLLKINNERELAKVKIAYYTVQNIVSVFDNRLERIKEPQCSVKADFSVTFYQFKDKTSGQNLLSYWDGRNIPSDFNVSKPCTIVTEVGLFKDPVWIDLITGQIQEIPKERRSVIDGKEFFTDLPIYDAPVLITERDRVLAPSKESAE